MLQQTHLEQLLIRNTVGTSGVSVHSTTTYHKKKEDIVIITLILVFHMTAGHLGYYAQE